MKITVQNKTIGYLEDNIFTKKVKESKHLLRIMDAWGIDFDVFNEQLNNTTIRIIDIETDTEYETTSNIFKKKGVIRTFGNHGQQIFLSRKHFEVRNKQQQRLI